MGINPKTKGVSGERDAIELLSSWAYLAGHLLTIERNLEQVRKGGSDLIGIPGMDVEVKRVEADGINQWWDQCCKAADKQGTHPLLMHRKNRHPWRFRTRVYVALYGEQSSGVIPMVVDFGLADAKVWFQSFLHYKLGPVQK